MQPICFTCIGAYEDTTRLSVNRTPSPPVRRRNSLATKSLHEIVNQSMPFRKNIDARFIEPAVVIVDDEQPPSAKDAVSH